eukprot:scaffold189_cov249-Pinguiococcus_pyrenoidosus.AAC.18
MASNDWLASSPETLIIRKKRATSSEILSALSDAPIAANGSWENPVCVVVLLFGIVESLFGSSSELP